MLQIRAISSALQETATRELNEDPNRISNDISYIRNWIAQQPHIQARTDDQWILNFLRGCKFSLERTKEKFDLFYTTRTLMPKYFSNRDPFLPEIQQVLNAGLFLPLPKTVGDNGPRIILLRHADIASSVRLELETLVKTFIMINDILLKEDDNYVIGGQHLIVDLAGSSLEYLTTINLSECKKLEICMEKAYPSRPQAFDVINSSAWYETLFNLVRSMMSEKIKRRLHIYSKSNSENIYEIIPRPYLPLEYGGECGTIIELTAYWKNKVENHRDWLIEDEHYCVDETKRPGKPKTAEDMFGVEGSFRKLEVD